MRIRAILSLSLVLLLALPIVMQVSPHEQALETTTYKSVMTESAISEPSKSADFVYTDHPAVTVSENDDFLTEGFTGLGTDENPYVLEGKNITSHAPAISISNTTAHFVIRNCKVLGAPPFTSLNVGVKIEDARNGRIEGCNFTRLGDGVEIHRSSGIVVRNTTFTDCVNGVDVWEKSNYTVVQNNTFTDPSTVSLYIQESHRIDVLDNIFRSPPHTNVVLGHVRAWDANYVSFARNRFIDISRGLALRGNHSLFEDNLFEVHRQHGMEIVGSMNSTLRNNTYLYSGDEPLEVGSGFVVDRSSSMKDSSDIHIYDCVVDGLTAWVSHTTNLTIENCNYTNSLFLGLGVSNMSGPAIIRNNRFINISYEGISSAYNPDDVVFHSNLIADCSSGFEGTGNAGTFRNNTLLNNDLGIYLGYYSQTNEVYYNIIAGSTTQNAQDDGIDNVWDDGEGLGNFWDDYDGTGTYSIYGPIRDQYTEDRWPVIYELDAPVIIQVESLTFASDSAKVVRWNVSDTTPRLYVAYVDDVAIESGEWDGTDIFVNLTSLTT
ncbi:MAG: right-handed parallel beta-helix repeat-containing protein, partial [Candidatus Thorarchaeota archaeon]